MIPVLQALSPKQLKIGIAIIVIITIVTAGFFTYRFMSGMVDKIGDLSGEVESNKMSLANANLVIESQEKAMREIGLRVEEMQRLKAAINELERTNNNKIKNLQRQLSELRHIEDAGEYSIKATETLRKRIRCLEVAAGSRALDEGESCE